MSFSFFARDWATNRELFRRKPGHIHSLDERHQLHCVLLHGWHSLYAPLLPLEHALRERMAGQNVRFWRGTYDSHWKPFTQSARELMAILLEEGVEPQNTVLIGYSMGGLVARAMVADGFAARAVITIGTPHLGPAPWMPTQFYVGDPGSLSIAPRSARLARLNTDPLDQKARENYHFYALAFTDATGFQAHDRIVTQKSALGAGLEGVGSRHSILLKYPGVAQGCDPHLRGMDPEFMAVAIEKCADLLTKPQD